MGRTFPPYAVLDFQTIALHLRLGVSPGQSLDEERKDGEATSPFDRVPGLGLYGADGGLVGSLHVDDLSSVDELHGKVECLVLSRCQTPTAASALLDRRLAERGGVEAPSDGQPWDLFWVLAVVWQEGIAERRGIGQVLVSALERSLEPGPEIKAVLLG